MARADIGDYGRDPLFAYAYTTGLGYRFADVPWTPHFWLYYDYASGDAGADRDGNYNTFNQLFPFGHYYFGFADLVGRQNINDFFLSGFLWPQKWLTLNSQFHVFRLDSDKDALYGPGGNVVRSSFTT